MSLFKRLFGGGKSAPEVEPEVYKGCSIYPEPVADAGGHRIAARIEKEIGGEVKTHHLIRADVCGNLDEATQLSTAKARQIIDEQGDAIFD